MVGTLSLVGTARLLFLGRHKLTPLVRADVKPVVPRSVWIAIALPIAVVVVLSAWHGNLSHDRLLAYRAGWVQRQPHSYIYQLDVVRKLYVVARSIVVANDEVTGATYVGPTGRLGTVHRRSTMHGP